MNRGLRAQSGFSLIEGMLAAVVLALGLLTLSGIQAISFGGSGDAKELTRVTNMAADMVERIQFNRRNVAAYNNIDTQNAGTQPPTSQYMARGDYALWQALLNASGLTNVRGVVAVQAIGPSAPFPLNESSVAVIVTWTGAAKGECEPADTTCTGGAKVARNRSVTLTAVVAPE